MPDKQIVTDGSQDSYDLETAKQFDEAFALSDNRASNEELAERASRVVRGCLSQAENDVRKHRDRWYAMDRLWRHESLSDRAEEYAVHMGGPFKAGEEYAVKMKSSVFGQRGFIDGEVENVEDEEKSALSIALIEEQIKTEARMPQNALAHFREAAIFGNRFGKVIPKKEVHVSLTREVTGVTMPDGSTRYVFEKPEEERLASNKLSILPVSVFDFRIPETADSIEDAGWCGDYSFPSRRDIDELVERGDYDSARVKELFDLVDKDKEAKLDSTPSGFDADSVFRSTQGGKDLLGAKKDKGPHIDQIARFEWWGDFDIEGTGEELPCVITILLPASQNQPVFSEAVGGTVVRVTRNPYLHQKKPYLNHPVIKREGELYSPSILEIAGKHSHFEDELAALGLMQGYLEASPVMEVGEASGVDEQDLDGPLSGKVLFTEQPGQVGFITPPVRSGNAVQLAEYFSKKATDVVGMGRPDNAPRTAAAGILTEAQEMDQRLVGYIDAYENHWLVPLAEFAHAYNKQYMTSEKKVKTLGVKGMRANDIRTVRPTDVSIDLRFEPVVGRKLVQKAFQVQGLQNWFDRAMQMNMVAKQSGEPPMFNLFEFASRIFKDGFGFTDISSLMTAPQDPENMRTIEEEHKAFSMGERPAVQKGEKTWMHVQGHIAFLRSGQAAQWRQEDKQAFIDHVFDTIKQFEKEVAQAVPDTAQIVGQLFEQLGGFGEPTTPGGMSQNQGQQGGRGVAMPSQNVGSPNFRRPNMPMAQGASMQAAPNMGAM
jgi:hypothetical protein